MRVATAQIPAPATSQDRVLADDRTAIVLDGATAFEPVDVPTSTYVDHLATNIMSTLQQHPEIALTDAVEASIRTTARTLDLHPGNSPSSTICVLRARAAVVDLLCLGDSAIYYGTAADDVATLTDSRLAHLGLPEHRAYRDRVAAGHGYDERHRELLAELQRKQRARRNRPDGYWIAEADPDAARHALVRTVPRTGIAWAVLATDGAYDPMLHLGLADWPRRARESASQLKHILALCTDWEKRRDPNGRDLPRAKVSDDKTLAAIVL